MLRRVVFDAPVGLEVQHGMSVSQVDFTDQALLRKRDAYHVAH